MEWHTRQALSVMKRQSQFYWFFSGVNVANFFLGVINKNGEKVESSFGKIFPITIAKKSMTLYRF